MIRVMSTRGLETCQKWWSMQTIHFCKRYLLHLLLLKIKISHVEDFCISRFTFQIDFCFPVDYQIRELAEEEMLQDVDVFFE